MIALFVLVLLIGMILIRVPVSFAILASGLIGLYLILSPTAVEGLMQTIPASSVQSTAMSAVPLFILMAHLMLLSGLMDSMFDAARAVLGRTRGGTGLASAAAGVAFAAVSGSSTASAATLAKTTTQRMITEGYHPQSAQGLVASVGTLAGMIPPSIVLVFYAITAEASVGDLLIAGIVPGLIIGAALVLTMYAGMLRNPSSVPAGRAVPWGHKLAAVVQALPILIVFGSVVGSIFFGIATATEAAAIGCLAALVLVMARKKFNWPAISEALLETVKTSAMIFAIIIGAHIFGHFITETRTTDAVLAWVGSLNTHALVIMGAMTLGYLILGFFMDQVAIIALTVPIALPIVETLGYDPIWFGIFIVLMAEIGLITPPLGLNLFVVARTAGRPVTEVTLGAIPYAAAMLCVAIMFVLWPQIVMWVPSM